ncbi:MAG: ubiquinol oxidase subunit II [Chlamydiales bacterium]|nr:ubiquinol oxidase subunit II [Chlamydiales bacterium]
MNKKYKIAFVVMMYLAVLFATYLFLDTNSIAVLDPKGLIAVKEKRLLVIATYLMLIVVIPVFVLTFVVAWKYRADNKKAEYRPDWDYNFFVEALWWGVPCIIIAVLSVITWTSTHELDPFRPLDSKVKPLRVQVIALQWKWLFIYPEHNIASLNYLQIPTDTPINFELTGNSPMNSFWIPQLGGMIYAMPGMTTKLHLMANEEGEYNGVSSNLSGTGFAGMKFITKATSEKAFQAWVDTVKKSPIPLNNDTFTALIHPSANDPVVLYTLQEPNLFDQTVMKYMMPQ